MALNVLLVQSDAHGARTVREALAPSAHYDIDCVDSCALGLARLHALGRQSTTRPKGIAVMLVELSLTDALGLDIIDRLHAASPAIPIVILTPTRDAAMAEAGLQRGAQDFLLKERVDDYVLPKTLAAVIARAAAADTLVDARERAQITLNSIGDAVLCTDIAGNVSYLNVVAERLTGWPSADALGQPCDTVLQIVDATTGATTLNPLKAAARADKTIGLPSASLLIRRDGVALPIEDSSAPIHDRDGAVVGAVMVFHDVSTARAMTDRLAHLAQHDSLTNLPNRLLLHDLFTQELLAAKRHATVLAVLYLDLDRFKQINDSLGHAAGDQLLKTVASRLLECVRASDTVCRLGGDEFVIVLSEVAHARDAAICAEKVMHSLRFPVVVDGHEVNVSSSIGIAIFPDDGNDVGSLLQNADSAMYAAKGLGRDNYNFYRRELNTAANERLVDERRRAASIA